MTKVGTILKKERRKKGLTQEELGKSLGVSGSTVSMIERGDRMPSVELLEAISDFFNIDMDYVIGKTHVRRSVWYDEFGNEYQPTERKEEHSYYLDPESERLAIEIHNDPKLRILMSTVRKVPPEDIEALIAIAKRLEGKEED